MSFKEQKILLDNITCLDDGLADIETVVKSALEPNADVTISMCIHVQDNAKRKQLELEAKREFEAMIDGHPSVAKEAYWKQAEEMTIPPHKYIKQALVVVDHATLAKLLELQAAAMNKERQKYISKLETIRNIAESSDNTLQA